MFKTPQKSKKVMHLCTPPRDFTPKCGGFGHVTTLPQRVTCPDCKNVNPKQLKLGLVMALFIFFFIPSVTHAANFNEDFETFTVGSIASQGNFTIYATGTTQDVATDQFHAGAKSLKMRASGGSQSHVVYTSAPFAGKMGLSFYVRKSSATSFSRMCGWVQTGASNDSCYGQVEFSNAGVIRIQNNSAVNTTVGSYSANTWYKIDMEYTASPEEYRVRVDGGSWTSWISTMGSTANDFSHMDGFKFMQIGTADDLWIDDILPYPPTLPDAITTPVDGESKPVGLFLFEGTCSDIGLNYSMNWRDYNFLSTPNIECQSDGTWFNNYEIVESGGGGKPYYLYNHVTDTYVDIGVIGYLDGLFDWFLSVNYPPLNSENLAEVQEDTDFPIRIYYTIPDGIPVTQYQLVQYTDNTYSTIDETIDDNSIDVLDPDGLGYIDSTDSTTNGVTNYYKAFIGDGDIVSFTITFRLLGSTADGAFPVGLGGDTDLGPVGNTIRLLFIPKPSDLKLALHPAQTMLDQRLAFFYDVGDILSENLTGFTTESPSVTLPVLFGTGPDAELFDWDSSFMVTVGEYCRNVIGILLIVGMCIHGFLFAKHLVET